MKAKLANQKLAGKYGVADHPIPRQIDHQPEFTDFRVIRRLRIIRGVFIIG